ncbi:MAG: 4-hydroxy-3-methylbut-2-enyl diphosphate reductase [Candidatus Zixiibacteriota bacterium]|nr:MAG: 4-hydroxy-3-methylbut-2-enyl diphosphate reductase [candidate division Zixibacteria bacterium]
MVHNRQVVDFFKQKGVGQAESLDRIDSGTLVISAHGLSPRLKKQALAKGLRIVDTTCPLVENVHIFTRQLINDGYKVILYGEPEHDEVMGVMGIDGQNIHLLAEYDDIDKLPKFEGKVALITQTTRGVRAFEQVSARMKEIYPDIKIVNTICDATDKRQHAIHDLAPNMDMVLVIGSHSSGNSHRLRDIAKQHCGRAYLIDSPEDIDWSWFDGCRKVGITAGASTPSFSVEQILKALHERVGIDLANSDARILDYKSFAGYRNVQPAS